MSLRAAALRAAAVISWGGAIGMSFTDTDLRLWACSLSAAVVSSIGSMQQLMAAKAARLYTAMTRAAITRPPYHEDPPSGPFPVIPIDRGRRHARHASRGLAPA